MWGDHTRDAFDAIIKDACTTQNGAFRALMPLYLNNSFHGPAGRTTFKGPADAFHPNDAGHAAIARLVLDALASLGA